MPFRSEDGCGRVAFGAWMKAVLVAVFGCEVVCWVSFAVLGD